MQLIQEAQEAFYDGRLTVAHAFEIARLHPRERNAYEGTIKLGFAPKAAD